MLVTAIVPCYNAGETIGKAIDSLLCQSHKIDEIIVVNDGSTDDSLNILNKIQKANESILIIDQKNQGVCHARNTGIEKSTGTYILTLDADDYFEPTFVEKALDKFAENESYGAVMCGYTRIVNGKKKLPYIPPEIFLKSCLLNNGALSCLLFKKEVLIQAGGYDENMDLGYEDWDLNIRILKLGYTFGVVREVLFHYTDQKTSRNYRAFENDLELRLKIYEKYREDYEENSKYFFKELIEKNNMLKRDNAKLLESTSFKLGHAFITIALKPLTYFKRIKK
ncbi:family 2 glycosyl transferase [Nonlabens sp. YIK11]|uniref:glycosyltransferase family 2 protein n=1 Tax=Nonlabens sp. YIK11 TaxID=1453349 RepID=UPI0006DC1B06|nr:glycosyltransferase family A protein [Nonlabens sp. YIK11]KQC34145.1 family 2 glycosyl transferase [Nonlabens sp. YIK11]